MVGSKLLAAKLEAVQQAAKKLAAAKRALRKEEERITMDPQTQAERGGVRMRATRTHESKPNPGYNSNEYC